MIKLFSTPTYHGAWFPYSGDRMALRSNIEAFLQETLKDKEGRLNVGDTGPEWTGTSNIELSYSHSKNQAILVWTTTHRIGVDLEPLDREYSYPPLELASRFFHDKEIRRLQAIANQPQALTPAFLDLWLKKEAYAKLTRNGLKQSIHIEVDSLPDVSFEVVPVIPIGYDSRVAHQTR